MKGALDVVLRHCSMASPSGELLTPALHQHFTTVASDYGRQGLRGLPNYMYVHKSCEPHQRFCMCVWFAVEPDTL